MKKYSMFIIFKDVKQQITNFFNTYIYKDKIEYSKKNDINRRLDTARDRNSKLEIRLEKATKPKQGK